MNANSHLLLVVDGESKSDSANVVQFGDNGTPDHLWTLEAASDPQWSYGDFEDGGWEIVRNDGGVRSVLASGSYAWSTSGQVAVRFAAVGGTLTLGVVHLSGAVDTLGEVFDVRFPAGKAGLRANAAAASFDAARVTAG